MSRNITRTVLRNDHEFYKKKAKDRGISHFRQLSTPQMSPATADQVLELKTIPHIWSAGDKYFKLAAQYYGDPTYWWIIAWFNHKPTEAHLALGDPVYVPLPLEEAISIYQG